MGKPAYIILACFLILFKTTSMWWSKVVLWDGMMIILFFKMVENSCLSLRLSPRQSWVVVLDNLRQLSKIV